MADDTDDTATSERATPTSQSANTPVRPDTPVDGCSTADSDATPENHTAVIPVKRKRKEHVNRELLSFLKKAEADDEKRQERLIEANKQVKQ